MSHGVLANDLIEAFVKLAKGDFSVRLERNYTRDSADTLAFFVNLIAEELARLMAERQRNHDELEAGVQALSEAFLKLAAGDFEARAQRSGRGDPLDVLAYLFNNTTAEVGETFAALEQQRQLLAATFEAMVDGVIVLDAEGRIVRVNRAIAGLLEHSADSMVGRPIDDFVAPREEVFGPLLESGELVYRDTNFSTARGEPMSLVVNGSVFWEGDGALAGAVLVARDERQLRAARAQLQLADRMATMGTLAAGVAHEINNPLSFVLANLDFLEEELEELTSEGEIGQERGDELQRALRSAKGGAERVRRIVRDLKTFSRGDQNVARQLELNQVVESSINIVRNEVRHHARLRLDFGDVPPLVGDESKIGQVVLNLVQNAAHAIPMGDAEHNEITVRTGTTALDEAFIEVRDTGCGIPPDRIRRIFDAFYTTKPVGIGTGLGLSICHKIVTSIGGEIDVDSTVNRGTSFRVRFPITRPASSTAPSPSEGPTASSSPRRILVVDDEPEVGVALQRILERSHRLDVVGGAHEALERLKQGRYDVILCDLLMPQMTGMDFHDRLLELHPELVRSVVFMTGGAFDPRAREFLERIEQPHVEKPFDAERLHRAIEDVVRRSESSS